MISKSVKSYLSRIDKEMIGEIENADIRIEGSVCDITGDWKDVISVYITFDGDRIGDIKGKCGPCDPYAYVALNIICKSVSGMKCSDVYAENPDIERLFYEELEDENDEEMKFHFERILKLIEKEIKNVNG